MRKSKIIGALGALGLLAASSAAHATITYTFDTDNQGWQVGNIGGVTVPTPNGAASWSSGQLIATDQAPETGFYAPGAVLGNQSAAYGGNISFDVSDQFNDNVPAYVALILFSDGLSISTSHAPPGTSLVNFSFGLTEANFTVFNGNTNPGTTAITQAQFQSVLANLTGVAIRSEWNTGPDDSVVDNVVFTGFGGDTAPPGAVPEPASWALMIGGFGLAGAALRRRRTIFA